MNILKLIGLTLLELGKQICLLPRAIVNGLKQRQEQVELNERETERLDRIRNPSKYLGK